MLTVAALKCDLREDPQLRENLAAQRAAPLTYDQGLETAKRIGATRYLGPYALESIKLEIEVLQNVLRSTTVVCKKQCMKRLVLPLEAELGAAEALMWWTS